MTSILHEALSNIAHPRLVLRRDIAHRSESDFAKYHFIQGVTLLNRLEASSTVGSKTNLAFEEGTLHVHLFN